jgi:glycosyltransferase involved in cell wall biosynthesis
VKPVVSIITPYLNAAAFLGEAIASVEDQTFPQWELILVDDGSTDKSREIAGTASARDARIRSLVRPSDRDPGAASARNWGIEQATGDFLLFLDADDRFLPAKLSTEIGLMDRFPEADLTCGGTIWWHPEDETRNWSDEIRSISPGLYDPPFLVNLALLLQRTHVPCLCGAMVRRNAVPRGDPFELSLSLYEDQSFLLKILSERRAYIGRHVTALYRQHRDSTSSKARELGEYRRIGPHRARTKFLAWARAYLEARPQIFAKSEKALLLAEAIQSKDYSSLEGRQRADLIAWRARKIIATPPKRAWGWLRRRYLLARSRTRSA